MRYTGYELTWSADRSAGFVEAFNRATGESIKVRFDAATYDAMLREIIDAGASKNDADLVIVNRYVERRPGQQMNLLDEFASR